MGAPSITLDLIDPGSLGQPISTDQVPIYFGVASQGDLNTVQEFGNLNDVIAEYDHGHLVDVAEAAFAGGADSVKLCRLTTSVAGDIVGEDDTDATLLLTSVTGTPLNFLRVRIECVAGGAGAISTGTRKIKYSLDAWDIPNIDPTFGADVTVPAGGSISLAGTGLTVVIETTQVPDVGDFIEFDVYAGHYGSTEIAAATTALQSPLAGDYTYAVYTGDAATAAAANTIANAIETQLSTLFSAARFIGALAGASRDTDTDVITAIAATAIDPPFLSLGYGAAYVTKSRAQQGRGRMSLREHEVAAIRIRQSLVSTDPGRVASGALGQVVGTDYDARLEGEALHDARVGTLRSWEPATKGLYITRQKMLADVNSNFVSWQLAAVMIVALRAAHKVGVQLILESLRRTSAGTLDPRDAADIERAMLGEIERVLLTPLNVRGTQGHISAASVSVSKTTPLPALSAAIRIRPLGWPDELTFTLEYADAV